MTASIVAATARFRYQMVLPGPRLGHRRNLPQLQQLFVMSDGSSAWRAVIDNPYPAEGVPVLAGAPTPPAPVIPTATTTSPGLMSGTDKAKLTALPTVQRTRAQTNAQGTYTWTFPAPFPEGTKPIIQLTVEDATAGATWNHRITALSHTSVTIALSKSNAVTVVGISVLGVAANPQGFVHLVAVAPQ